MRRVRTQAIRRAVRRLLQTSFLLSFLFSAITFTSLSAQAASVTLSWDPSNVSGASYKVYYGGASGVYTNALWIGSNTNGTIDNLNTNGTYYFSVTTFDASGHESSYSSEVNYTFASSSQTNQTTQTNQVTQPPPVNAVPINGFTMTRRGPSFWPQGASGVQYIVQASSNLVNWVSLQTNTAPFTYVDTNSSQFNQRFYRVIQAQ